MAAPLQPHAAARQPRSQAAHQRPRRLTNVTGNYSYTDHVYDCDYVIACDAGRRETTASSARILPRRLQRSFDITYRKTQDGSRGYLHAAGDTGKIKGFVHAYLGMNDRALPMPGIGLVPASRVNGYPTNFAPVDRDDLTALTGRGYQLTRLLTAHYCPSLLAVAG